MVTRISPAMANLVRVVYYAGINMGAITRQNLTLNLTKGAECLPAQIIVVTMCAAAAIAVSQ